MSERAGDVRRHRDQRREQMLRAAIGSSRKRGFRRPGSRTSPRRAGTSPALVIYYFKPRDSCSPRRLRYAEDAWYELAPSGMAASPAPPGGSRNLVA